MTAALASTARELVPRDLAKWFARTLGVSIRTGKRYAAHPELFPRSRAEQLLIALEKEEAELEARRALRREAREAVKREVRAALGLDGPSLGLDQNRGGDGLPGLQGLAGGGDLPVEGGTPSEITPAARDARR